MTKDKLFELTIKKPDGDIYQRVKNDWDSLAKPIDGLGDFEDIICRVGSIMGKAPDDISKKVLVIFCSDNGVVEEGVSQTGKEVTAKVASLMGKNLSTVGRMTAGYPLDIIPVDIGMDCENTPEGVFPRKIRNVTGNILKESAMSEEECLKAIEMGIEIAKLCKDRGYHIS